jgi:hypothetical protein
VNFKFCLNDSIGGPIYRWVSHVCEPVAFHGDMHPTYIGHLPHTV